MILADIAVYRELFAKWARFFPPGDHEALASALVEVLETPPPTAMRSELETRFSWIENARITASTYERVVA